MAEIVEVVDQPQLTPRERVEVVYQGRVRKCLALIGVGVCFVFGFLWWWAIWGASEKMGVAFVITGIFIVVLGGIFSALTVDARDSDRRRVNGR